MSGWAVKRIVDVPRVTDGDEGDPDWHPLQHHFGLTAFGANVFVAREAGQELIAQHDEAQSGQEELYLVLAGEAEFALDGETVPAPAGSVVAVPDARVTRRAVAAVAGTTLLALGAPGRARFESTWRSEHFADVPLIDD